MDASDLIRAMPAADKQQCGDVGKLALAQWREWSQWKLGQMAEELTSQGHRQGWLPADLIFELAVPYGPGTVRLTPNTPVEHRL